MYWVKDNKEYKELSDFNKDVFGFIYVITYSNGKKYLGSKYLYHKKRVKNRKTIYTFVESNWKNYKGSLKNEEFKNLIKTKKVVITSRKILHFCKTPKEVSYYETKLLFLNSCLESEEYLNDTILGKFYRRDICQK